MHINKYMPVHIYKYTCIINIDLPKTSDITAQNVRENFAPLSKENGEGPNNNNTEFDGNNIVDTIISLLCGLCNKNSIDDMLGLDEQNNTTQRLVDHPGGTTDDPNNTGELLTTYVLLVLSFLEKI